MHHLSLSCAALLLAAALIPAADAQTTWDRTSTQGITAAQLDRATDLGPVNGDQAITVRVGLPMQNKAALEAYVKRCSWMMSPFSRRQHRDRHSSHRQATRARSARWA